MAIVGAGGTETGDGIDQGFRACTRTDDDEPRSQKLGLSNMHRSSGVLKLELQRTNQFTCDIGNSHNRDGFRIPKCFLQVFRSAGNMCNLGTSIVESDGLG